jgi:hypothetical protein
MITAADPSSSNPSIPNLNRKKLKLISIPISDNKNYHLTGQLPILLETTEENESLLSDIIRPVHLRGVHMVAIAYRNIIFIMTEVPSSPLDIENRRTTSAPIPQCNLILLKRIVFKETVQAVRWVLAVDSLILLISFSTCILIFTDEWKQLAALDTLDESILSFDCGPAVPKDSFTLVLNTSKHSSIHQINALTGQIETKIQIDWNGKHLRLDDWLGLEASRPDGLFCHVDQEFGNWVLSHK